MKLSEYYRFIKNGFKNINPPLVDNCRVTVQDLDFLILWAGMGMKVLI
jgi:hypothetical protein